MRNWRRAVSLCTILSVIVLTGSIPRAFSAPYLPGSTSETAAKKVPPTNPSGPAISVWSPLHSSGNITDPSILPGDNFTVSVRVTNAPEYDAYSFNLEYNPTVVELVSTTLQGTVFYQHTTISFVSPQSPGILGAAVLGTAPTQGNGTLLTTSFKALLTSLTNIRITNSILSRLGVHIQHTDKGGCFTNRTPIVSPVDFTTDPSPGYSDTSSFMAGRIAVGIILPQGNSSNYIWTDAEVNQTINGIRDAMHWWASQDPGANLTFYYNIHIRLPTIYEPITMPLTSDTVWIADVMNRLGYSGDAVTATRAYDNAIRNANNTDWAFAIFVANSDPNVGQGLFSTGGYAHAYIGGPWLTMSRFSTWAYNYNQYYQAVPAHETGHIFGATDEYISVPFPSGYLWTPSAYGSFGIMNQNYLKLSTSTQVQVGHVDCNGDGVPDILETPLAIKVNSPPTLITSPATTITGEAIVIPYPTFKPGGRSIAIGKITSVQYTIDQGPWANAVPADGAFDSEMENFAFNLIDPPPGTHTVHILATNNAGKNATTGFTVNLPVGAPSFARWGARPADHHLDTTTTSEEIFQADIKVTGTQAYVYIQYRITSDTGATYPVLSRVTRFSPNSETILQSIWTPPPVQSRYHVSATIYYSPWAGEPNTPAWTVGPSKDFMFKVTM